MAFLPYPVVIFVIVSILYSVHMIIRSDGRKRGKGGFMPMVKGGFLANGG